MQFLKAIPLFILLLAACSQGEPPVENLEEDAGHGGGIVIMVGNEGISPNLKADFVQNIGDAINSTVRLEYQNAIGSGFVIGVGRDITRTKWVYTVISAAHVFSSGSFEQVTPYVKHDQREVVRATFYNDKKKTIRTGKVKKLDTIADLAVLVIEGGNEVEPLCKSFWFYPGEKYLQYMTDVALIGYPQGVGPIVTTGHISGISVLSWDNNAFTTTAQSAPGSSGGPVVDMETGKVVGMLRAVLRMPSTGQLLTWTSIITPVDTVKNFYASYIQDLYLPALDAEIKPGETSRGQETPSVSSFTPPATVNGNVLIFTPNESKQVLYR